MQNKKTLARFRRKNRIRHAISAASHRPRLSVFRSNAHIYAQIIDDVSGKTLVSSSDIQDKKMVGTKTEKAFSIGEKLGEKAIAQGLSKVVFDRNGYLFHGRIKALAEGARKSGLQF